MAKIYVKQSGTWKSVEWVFLKQSGSWIRFPVDGGGVLVDTPAIVTPSPSSTLSSRGSFQATSTPFTVIGGTATHASSSWQISLDSSFSTVEWEKLDSSSDLTSVTVPSGVLKTSGAYYIRVQYKASTGALSEWSSASLFNSPAITPDLEFTTNLPPTLSSSACNGYTFTVAVQDKVNRGTTFTYQWYFNGIAAGPNSPSWSIPTFYYSDNTKQVYCKVTGTNSGLSSSINSQTCTLSISRSTDIIRTDPDINNGFRRGSFEEKAVSSSQTGDWSECNPKGVFLADIPAGQGRLILQSGSPWEASKNGNTPGGINCNSGKGTQYSVAVRFCLREKSSGCRTNSWNDSECNLDYKTQNDENRQFGGSQGSINTVDLDPTKQYQIYYECKNNDTVDRCTCDPAGTDNFKDCSRTSDWAFWNFRVNSETRWNYTPAEFKCDTRPTPTPTSEEGTLVTTGDVQIADPQVESAPSSCCNYPFTPQG